jgi:hypothetical protein
VTRGRSLSISQGEDPELYESRVSEKVTTPKAPRLLEQAVRPFHADLSQKPWAFRDGPSDEVKCCAYGYGDEAHLF